MLVKLLLGPFLLVQGYGVRKSIIKLPEASGQRSGSNGVGPPLKMMILGDSAAAGVGAKEQQDALSGQLSSRLSKAFRLSWKLIARTGETTDSIHALLDEESSEDYDVIVVSLGVNDVTSGKSCRAFISQTKALIHRLDARYSPQQIVFTGLPPMGHFPALPNPLRWYLGRQSQRFDRALEKTVKEFDCDYFKQDMTPDPELIADDGFHPGPPVYSLWAEGIANLIRCKFKLPD